MKTLFLDPNKIVAIGKAITDGIDAKNQIDALFLGTNVDCMSCERHNHVYRGLTATFSSIVSIYEGYAVCDATMQLDKIANLRQSLFLHLAEKSARFSCNHGCEKNADADRLCKELENHVATIFSLVLGEKVIH